MILKSNVGSFFFGKKGFFKFEKVYVNFVLELEVIIKLIDRWCSDRRKVMVKIL